MDSSRSVISSTNQRNEERNEDKTRAVNSEWLCSDQHFWLQRMHFTCKSYKALPHVLKPCGELANTGDKMRLPHYSVPHAHLIVNIAIALTANKHNLIARQLFDGRKTGSLEMILRWETSLLSFCMRFCFHSSLPSPSPQWLYFSTNSTSKHYSHYKITPAFIHLSPGVSFANSRYL